jgi:hypothetical protein
VVRGVWSGDEGRDGLGGDKNNTRLGEWDVHRQNKHESAPLVGHCTSLTERLQKIKGAKNVTSPTQPSPGDIPNTQSNGRHTGPRIPHL